MAKRFYSTFYDISGAQVTVDIYDTDFVGAATEFTTKACQITYDSSANDDLSSPIIGSRAKVGMVIPTTDSTLTTFVEDFATGVEDRFTIEIGKTAGPDVVWRGILVPDFTGEEDTAPSFIFNISAVCGLGLLKKIPYHDGAEIYTGIERFTKHITRALSKLNHTDGFWGASDVFIKTAVDWWAVSMAATATDDGLYQGGVDNAAFYQFATQGNVDKDVLSCYDVLWHILKAFECRIFQIDGSWWIEQVAYRTSSSYYTRHYSKSGGYLSNATNSGVNTIDQTDSGAKIATVNYDFLPALERAEVTYDVNLRRNFLAGTVQNAGNFDTFISSNAGAAVMSLRFRITYEVTNDTSPLGATTQYYIIPQVTLKVGDNYLSRDYTITNFTAHVTPLSWETAGTIAAPILLGAVPVGTTKQGWFEFDMICPPLPDDGSDNYFGVPAATAEMTKQTGGVVDETDFTISIDISSRFLEIFDLGTPVVSEDKVLYKSENSAVATEIYETAVRIGSAAIPNSLGRAMRWDGAAWNLATYWGQGVDTRDDFLGDLLARNILNSRDTIRRRLNGTIYGTLNPKKLLSTIDGKKWMFGNVTWDLGRNTLQGTWFELNYGTAGVNSTPIKIKIEPSGGTTIEPAPTSGGGTNTSPGFASNPPPTVLAPVAYNGLDGEIDAGDVITSIPIKIASLGNEFLAGDGVTLVNPVTGQYQTFEIATAPAFGATSLSVVSEASSFNFPEDSYLVVKQNAYAFSLPTATQGQILRYNDTTDVWEAYSGTTDGHVLTWDTTNGWQSEAASGGVAGYNKIRDNNTLKTQRESANFLNTATVSWALSDDAGDAETEITANVVDASITFAKIQDIATSKLLGRITAGTGDVEEVSLNGTLEFSGVTLRRAALTGDVTAPAGSGVTSIANNAVVTAKIADDAVTTAKVANDAITLAKLQNAVAANIILGNNASAGSPYVELSVAQTKTLLGFIDSAADLTTPRIPYISAARRITDSANFRWLDGTQEILIGDGTSRDARFSHNFTNTPTFAELFHGEGIVNGDYQAIIKNTRNVSNTGRAIMILEVGGVNSGDAFYVVRTTGGDQWSFGLDKSDGNKFKITPKSTGPGSVANSGIIVTNAATALVGINKDAPAHPLDVGGRIRGVQYMNTNVEPTFGAAGNGLGTGGTIDDISGADNAFTLQFTSGTAPTAGGPICTVTYSSGWPSFAVPVFCQANDNAGNEISKFVFGSFGGASFELKVRGGQTLTASKTYLLNFVVGGQG